MDGHTLFALIFIAIGAVGLPIGMFIELGGMDILAKKFVELIDSYNKKKKDI